MVRQGARIHETSVVVGCTLVAVAAVALLLVGGWIYFTFFFDFSFEGPPRVQEIALADIDGDGHIDAYLAVAPDGEPYVHPDYLLLNEGDGRFRDSQQNFDDMPSFSVMPADLNGDGHMDVVTGRYNLGVHLNNGHGSLQSYTTRNLPDGVFRAAIALADLDSNGIVDIFAAGCCGFVEMGSSGAGNRLIPPSSLVLLIGDSDPGAPYRQQIDAAGSNDVALADLNGDGTVDAFLAHGRAMTNPQGIGRAEVPNTVWWNDGHGIFTDSGQLLGQQESMAVALGDVNGDGFPDAAVGNRGPDEIWLNDGRGYFSDSGQQLGNELTRSIFLMDLDGDGDLDLVTGGEETGRLWFNDGSGRFTESNQPILYDSYDGIVVGDVTGDGVPDIFVAGVGSYQVWRGEGDGRFTAEPYTEY